MSNPRSILVLVWREVSKFKIVGIAENSLRMPTLL